LPQLGLKIFQIAPEAAAPFMTIASGLSKEEVAALPITDGLRIVNAMLDANETDQLAELFRDFFSKITARAKQIKSGAANHTPMSSS